MGDNVNFCLDRDRDEIKIWWNEFLGHFCNFYYYQVIWRTSPVTWRHWGRPFSQQCRGSWTGSTRSAWPQPTRPLSSARWISSIIFIVLKKDTDCQLCSLQVFNLGLQLKTEELYKGIVRRDSIWDKLLFWFVRQKVRIYRTSTRYLGWVKFILLPSMYKTPSK